MVQNPKYWRAKECARLQNKTQLTRKSVIFLCLYFPVESCHILLLSNILDFVPCDLQLQSFNIKISTHIFCKNQELSVEAGLFFTFWCFLPQTVLKLFSIPDISKHWVI